MESSSPPQSAHRARGGPWGVIVGLVAGVCGSALGIGGGLIMTPAFALIGGLELRRAVGTSLAVIPFLASAAVAVEACTRPEYIHLPLALFLAMGAVVGSRIGFAISRRTGDRHLRWLFAAFLLYGAAQVGKWIPWQAQADLPLAAFLGVGLAAGIASSLFGIGGGILAVPLMLVLSEKMPFVEARATSLVMIVIVSTTGAALFARGRLVEWSWFRRVLPAAMVGAALGVPLVHRIPESPVRQVFAACLIYTAWRMLRSASR